MMGIEFPITVGDGSADVKYTVRETAHGVALSGDVPVRLFVKFTKKHKNGVIDCQIADALGATIVICKNKKASTAWRESLGIRFDNPDWLRSGDTGTSSKTIYQVLSRKSLYLKEPGTPRDPDDFGRCYRLCKRFNWHGRIGEVAQKYQNWKPIADNWQDLCAAFDREGKLDERGFPTVKTMPAMYERMKKLQEI